LRSDGNYAVPSKGEMPRFASGARTSTERSPETSELLARDLEQKCENVLGTAKAQVHVRVVTAGSGEEDRLIECAKEDRADLIVVGTNQRRGLDRFWLGSVSRGILHHAATNVACIPMSAELA